MPRIHAAIIREQGENFVLVSVKTQVLDSSSDRKDAVFVAESRFGIPTVLVARDSIGNTRVWGRQDHLRFLSTRNIDTLRWEWYEFSDSESRFRTAVCAACDGKGKLVCFQCDRRGYFYDKRLGIGERCTVCNETGYIECGSCRGKGCR